MTYRLTLADRLALPETTSVRDHLRNLVNIWEELANEPRLASDEREQALSICAVWRWSLEACKRPEGREAANMRWLFAMLQSNARQLVGVPLGGKERPMTIAKRNHGNKKCGTGRRHPSRQNGRPTGGPPGTVPRMVTTGTG
jgi:hypothetical protein